MRGPLITRKRRNLFRNTITEYDSKQDQILLVKLDEYIGFCVHRRSYLLGSPVIINGFQLDQRRAAVGVL